MTEKLEKLKENVNQILLEIRKKSAKILEKPFEKLEKNFQGT